MISLEINGKLVEANNNETILDVLKREKIEVPTLCHLKDLTPTGACRMCVVEVEGMRNLVTSCSYPAMDGMKIQTHSKRVMDSRKTIIELLLAIILMNVFIVQEMVIVL
jgi:NADH dehydrogenase/NADH:ubiquinone oxidoreductase subunit G